MLPIVLLAASLAGTTQEPDGQFMSRSRTFALELPSGWQQLSPDEARRLRDLLPRDLHRTEPAWFYAVGPVDRWLEGDFDGRYLYVVEQREEWPMDEAKERLEAEWRELGDQEGVDHVLEDLTRTTVGPQGHDVIRCTRTSTPRDGGRAVRSLDVYAPTGGRMLLLSFRSWAGDFEAALPAFREMLATVTFARPPKGETTLQDKLLVPILTGILVGLILALLYRRRRRAA